MSRTKPVARQRVAWIHPWTQRQFLMIGLGVAVIIVGFVLLASGIPDNWDNPLAVSVAPAVLVIGYCVILPWAIMATGKKSEEQ